MSPENEVARRPGSYRPNVLPVLHRSFAQNEWPWFEVGHFFIQSFSPPPHFL